MIELLHIAQGIIERGLIFGIVVGGVYVASYLIHFDNLATEGAFGLGGACTALLISWGVNPWISLGAAMVAGALSGIVTGLLHTKLAMNNLMSGIVVTTGLFSIMLKIAGSNMLLHNKSTIFNFIPSLKSVSTPVILSLLCLCLFLAINYLLKSEIGYLLQAVGDNKQMLTNIGKNSDNYIIFGLLISNTCAALSGALFVQYVGYFSIWASVGILIIGLSGMILTQLFSITFGPLLLFGSIIYQAIIALTFEFQLDQEWNKLITALLIIILISAKQLSEKKGKRDSHVTT
ncbi:MAG TPA: hypothetical protein VJ201_03880 [Candidatus Babeliales bacterium]|nr:hypothetical protein [Candidatus Babeliales bacterium]